MKSPGFAIAQGTVKGDVYVNATGFKFEGTGKIDGNLIFASEDLKTAYEALDAGGTAPAILNASNEIAVEAFLADKIGFMDIPALIETVLSKANVEAVTSIAQLVEVDADARRAATHWLNTLACAH